MAARKPFSIYLSEAGLEILNARAAEAGRLVSVRITAPALAASLLHRALGLSPDGEPLESKAPPPAEPPTAVEAEPLAPAPPVEAEAPASSPPAEPAPAESAADVLAGLQTLGRVTDPAKRRPMIARYLKALQTRCNLSAAEALAVFREKSTKRRLRFTAADLDAAAKLVK